jgi:valyl-tRNA synthetase
MQKTYNPEELEGELYADWERLGAFSRRSGRGEPYCIVIPPPNVTGTLHMGHAFQDTIMDALTRYHRMLGNATLWQPGTDHAGIATQMVVERQLNGEGLPATTSAASASSSGSGSGRNSPAARSPASSSAWAPRSTGAATASRWMQAVAGRDRGLRQALRRGPDLSRPAAGQLGPGAQDGTLRPRGCQQEEQGSLWHFRYPLADGSGHLVVATTRPETMLGDTAVAVHPEDPNAIAARRAQHPPAARRARHPDRRRRLRRPGLRLRLRQDHPGARLQRYELGQRHGLAR